MSRESLIWDLIFSEDIQFKIDLKKYVDDNYHYDDFVEEIKLILKKSAVQIIESKVLVNSKSALWTLKVKK